MTDVIWQLCIAWCRLQSINVVPDLFLQLLSFHQNIAEIGCRSYVGLKRSLEHIGVPPPIEQSNYIKPESI